MALKVVVGQKIMADVVRGCTVPPATETTTTTISRPRKDFWRILVVDYYAMRIISSCCKVHDLAVEGILVIENISKKREPFPGWEAIYLVSPTEASVKAIIADFDNPKKLMYSSAHIFFTDVCSDDLFEKLGRAKCANRIQTVKEIDIAFLPYESQVFTLDSPEIFKLYYGIPKVPEDKVALAMDRMAEQIATLCATLNEFPYIRYSNYGNAEYNLKLSDTIQKKLNIYKQSHAPTMGSAGSSSRTQLLILDRSFDVVSPLLHELTFQAMAYDLLDIKNDSYKFVESAVGGSKEKEIYLDETDDLWRDLRHKPIGKVSEEIMSAVKKFSASKKGMMKDGGATNMKDLAKLVKAMPQYQKELKKYSNSSKVAEDCIKDTDRIRLLCKVEQDLAMTTDENGVEIRDREYMSILNPVLMDSIGVKPAEKLRVILLYLLTQKNGIPRERLDKLMQHGDLSPSLMSTLMNLELLGFNVTTESKITKETQVPHVKVRLTKEGEKEENVNIFQRWIPTVKYLIEDLMNGKLDDKKFPYLPGRVMNSSVNKAQAVSARFGNWQNKSGQGSMSSLPRLIIFIAGGISFSEMRCAYELSESKDYDVIIGSSHIITPNQFVDSLKDLK